MKIKSQPSMYILSELTAKNRFPIRLKFTMDGQRFTVRGIVDTGCTQSLISANLIYAEAKMPDMLTEDIHRALTKQGVKLGLGYGIEGIPPGLKIPDTENEIRSCKYVRFIKEATEVYLGGHRIQDTRLSISYQTKDNCLIGMGLLKNLYVLFGNIDDKTVLVATRNTVEPMQKIFQQVYKTATSLHIEDSEIIDFFDTDFDIQDMEANAVNKLLSSLS